MALQDDYPFTWTTYPETGPGWDGVLRRLCTGIVRELRQAGVPLKDFTVNQVKEKLGGLRFYYMLNRTVDGLGHMPRIDDLVCRAEIEAEQTCEECGKPGKCEAGEESGWLRTACPEHKRP